MLVENSKNESEKTDFIYVHDSKGNQFKIYLNERGNMSVKSLSGDLVIHLATKGCIILNEK